MLHIVSELMVASVLAAVPADALPTASPAVPQALPGVRPGAPAAAGRLEHASEPLGQATPAERLGKARGGTGIASDTRLGGEVANNTANQVVTGANRIDTGSFSGSVGLPVVIQNSGANVLIQNATVINLQFK